MSKQHSLNLHAKLHVLTHFLLLVILPSNTVGNVRGRSENLNVEITAKKLAFVF